MEKAHRRLTFDHILQNEKYLCHIKFWFFWKVIEGIKKHTRSPHVNPVSIKSH